MILCIPNGYQPKKNCCQTDGSFSFSASIQEVIEVVSIIEVVEKLPIISVVTFFMSSIDQENLACV